MGRRSGILAVILGLIVSVVPLTQVLADTRQIVDPAGDANLLNGQGVLPSDGLATPVDYGAADLTGVGLSTIYESRPVGADGIDFMPTALRIAFETAERPVSDGPTILYRLRASAAGCDFHVEASLGGPASGPTDAPSGQVRWRGLSLGCPQGRASVSDPDWSAEIVDGGLQVKLPFDSLSLNDLAVLGPDARLGSLSANTRVLAGPTTVAIDDTATGLDYAVASDVPADIACAQDCPVGPEPGSDGFELGVPYQMRGSGWLSFDVETEGADIGLLFQADHISSPMQVSGASYIYETNEFTGGMTLGMYGTSPYEPTFDSFATVAGSPVFYEGIYTRTHEDSFTSNPSIGFGGFPTRTKLLVSMTASRLAEWTFQINDVPGVRVHDFEVGSDARLLTNKDFDSTASVGVSAIGESRALVAGEKRIVIDETLIGTLAPVSALGAQAYDLSVVTPDGEQDCELKVGGGAAQICHFDDFVGPNAEGPGEYVFKATGAGAGIIGWADVVLFVLDARLPD